MLPHDPCFWQSLGLMARLTLSPKPEFEKHRSFAERIYQAPTLERAQDVANEILDPEKGIPNKDTDAVADMRWIAHSLGRDLTILRAIPYWRSLSYPRVKAKIF